jgi:hypothetical protein
MDGTRTYLLSKEAYDDFVAIKRHNILQTRDASTESPEYIASRWILSFFFETIVHFHNYVRYKTCTRGGSGVAPVSLAYLLD